MRHDRVIAAWIIAHHGKACVCEYVVCVRVHARSRVSSFFQLVYPSPRPGTLPISISISLSLSLPSRSIGPFFPSFSHLVPVRGTDRGLRGSRA